MRAGLEKHAEKIHDHAPYVSQVEPRESRDTGGPFRGRGRGRGGGGFAARGFASAGLVRGGGPGGEGRGDGNS